MRNNLNTNFFANLVRGKRDGFRSENDREMGNVGAWRMHDIKFRIFENLKRLEVWRVKRESEKVIT